jgi:nucleoside-diphosphate-sugar epimerase
MKMEHGATGITTSKEHASARSRFGRPRLLILGCGNVGMRLLPLLRDRFRIFAVTTQASKLEELRAAGAIPLLADLDRPATLARLARLAAHVVHLAPPQSDGGIDRRTRNLIAILPERTHLVYVSTTGVYGDCGGERAPCVPGRGARAVGFRYCACRGFMRMTVCRSSVCKKACLP